ncbi:hypothetical protein J6590_056526 [Homalodisca vitripennis]|nr:hypothetical protein J6590_056526 [Homalodisca vitripennis]
MTNDLDKIALTADLHDIVFQFTVICAAEFTLRSPLSENAIGRVIDEEFLDDSFVSNVSVCSEDSDSSESGLFGDNTYDDPDYILSSKLDQPGPSNRNVQTRPTQRFVSSDELSDEDVSPQPRPRTVIPDSSDENSDEDGSGWIEVNEENDPGYNENFSCSLVTGLM